MTHEVEIYFSSEQIDAKKRKVIDVPEKVVNDVLATINNPVSTGAEVIISFYLINHHVKLFI